MALDVEMYEHIHAAHDSDEADRRQWWDMGKKELIGALMVAHEQRGLLLAEVERLRMAELSAAAPHAGFGLRLLKGRDS